MCELLSERGTNRWRRSSIFEEPFLNVKNGTLMGWLAGLFSLRSSFSLPLCADYIESASTFSCCFEPWDVSSYIAIKNVLDLMYTLATCLNYVCVSIKSCNIAQLTWCNSVLKQLTYIINIWNIVRFTPCLHFTVLIWGIPFSTFHELFIISDYFYAIYLVTALLYCLLT